MSDKLSYEELKYKNELLKNKTEKLKLTRNVVAVLSIILSIVIFIFGIDGNLEKTKKSIEPKEKPIINESINVQQDKEQNQVDSNNLTNEDDLDEDED